ncbi:aminoglycoside phosphotransferase family protein [Paenibacillus sp. GCM10012303]|uniref:aminoglycoside phosphotransferase family protein n=1 Tax=Paenibacillus sp. GCM10012303 TaxID=3317340 RepID=UPI0036072C36
MEHITDQIRTKAEQLLNAKVDEIRKVENVPNNTVYKMWVQNKPYIFKIYKQRNWPEDGKLLFVNRQLAKHKIGRAAIIEFGRSDPHFHTGYVLEECLPGKTADQIVFNEQTGLAFYEKLARLVSRIHKIRIPNFGYIGGGIAGYPSLVDFVSEEFDERAKNLIKMRLFDPTSLLEIKNMVTDRLRLCDGHPSVLCHGDLSTKNVIVDEQGELTLIDWDDAMSYNWIADLSRMTYWMKFKYHADEYELYRACFMEYYTTDCRKSDFYQFENLFHVWIGLDFLNYYANRPQYKDTMRFFKETVKQLDSKTG